MKKFSVFLSAFLSVMAIGLCVLAVDYPTLDVGAMKASSLDVYNSSGTATFKGNVTLTSGKTLTLTGVTVTGGTMAPSSVASTTVSATGLLTLTPTAVTVTNAQTLTASASHYTLNSVGAAENATNTITLAAASASGQVLMLTVAAASTNMVTIADSAPVYASGAILMGAADSCMFVSVGTNWMLLCESDN